MNSKEGAEEYVLTAVGLLAGSSILLLTLLWGTCILLSSQNFSTYSQSNPASLKSHENFFLSLWPGYGVITDWQTCYIARMMLVSVIPFTIIQFPRLLHLSSHWEQIFVVFALVISVLLLLSYFFYQVFWPWIQRRQLLYLKHGHLVTDILKHIENHTMRRLYNDDGAPNLSIIRSIFEETDQNGDKYATATELKGFLREIKSGKFYSDKDMATEDSDVAISKTMEELDTNGDQFINEDEFIIGLSRLLNRTYINENPVLEEIDEPDYQKKWEETDKIVENQFIDKSLLAWSKAISLVVLGILMLGVVAEPLIHSVQNLSNAASIPSFFIAFIFVPLATNARITISAINEARRKKQNITSMTLSEIYGTVLMNNLLGLSVLLSLIYFCKLSWSFSIEVLMVLIVTAIVGCLASFSTVFPIWTSLFAYLLYPLSMVLVNILGDFKWSS